MAIRQTIKNVAAERMLVGFARAFCSAGSEELMSVINALAGGADQALIHINEKMSEFEFHDDVKFKAYFEAAHLITQVMESY